MKFLQLAPSTWCCRLVRSVEQRLRQPGWKLLGKFAAHHARNKYFQSKPTSQKMVSVNSSLSWSWWFTIWMYFKTLFQRFPSNHMNLSDLKANLSFRFPKGTLLQTLDSFANLSRIWVFVSFGDHSKQTFKTTLQFKTLDGSHYLILCKHPNGSTNVCLIVSSWNHPHNSGSKLPPAPCIKAALP